jgi:NAD(P)-dependent dehydrogenase (short-subunit alcohol dehydrogenase family)
MVQAGPYAASKAAVINLSKSVALEYADYHITSNVIVPDIIDTPANRTAMPEADFLQWTSPEEIAKTVVKIIESEQTNEIVRV